MFPERRVNALTPIFASLDREEEDLSLSLKIPLKSVHNSAQVLETFSINLIDAKNISNIFLDLLEHYRRRKQRKSQLKFNLNAAEEQLNTNLDAVSIKQAKSCAPFAKIEENGFEQELELLVLPLNQEQLIYGDIVQQVANDYQVVIALQQPSRVGQKLLKEGYSVAKFIHEGKFCEIGPMAGMLPYDASFCYADKKERESHKRQMDSILSQGAQLIDLVLSAPLIENALQYGHLQRVGMSKFAAIYFGVVFYFDIAEPDFVVRDFNTKQKIRVLANKDSLPIIENYYLRLILTRENTPNQLVAAKNKLVEPIVNALNNKVLAINKKQASMFTFAPVAGNLPKNTKEFFFLPKLGAKQLFNGTYRETFCQMLRRNGFIV